MENLLEKALEFATSKHKGVYRKFDKKPYIWHPISVAKIVQKYKRSKNIELLIIVCLLHDVVEDTDTTLQEIADLFGYKVASMVEELTSDKAEIAKIGKIDYLKNKMTMMSSYALVIKLSDRLDNVSDFESSPEGFVLKYSDETEAILKHIQSHRKLSDTHKKIIDKIYKKIKKGKN